MGLTLHLPAVLTCPSCGHTAHLVEGLLTRDVGEGVNVTVDSVPVYRCEKCLGETMELLSAAKLEDYLGPYLRDAQPHQGVRVNITWEKRRAASRRETIMDSGSPELLMTP